MEQRKFDKDYGVQLGQQKDYFVGSRPYAVECVRCKQVVAFGACTNCGTNKFQSGIATDGTIGMFCTGCNKGMTRWSCNNCGTDNALSTTFGTHYPKGSVLGVLVSLSFIAGIFMLGTGFCVGSLKMIGLGVVFLGTAIGIVIAVKYK